MVVVVCRVRDSRGRATLDVGRWTGRALPIPSCAATNSPTSVLRRRYSDGPIHAQQAVATLGQVPYDMPAIAPQAVGKL